MTCMLLILENGQITKLILQFQGGILHLQSPCGCSGVGSEGENKMW